MNACSLTSPQVTAEELFAEMVELCPAPVVNFKTIRRLYTSNHNDNTRARIGNDARYWLALAMACTAMSFVNPDLMMRVATHHTQSAEMRYNFAEVTAT